jgi:hypothetical protein
MLRSVSFAASVIFNNTPMSFDGSWHVYEVPVVCAGQPPHARQWISTLAPAEDRVSFKSDRNALLTCARLP